MRPCDAHDEYTAMTHLKEQGAYWDNHDGIEVRNGHVKLSIGPCKLSIKRSLMKHIAEWYLEDQDERLKGGDDFADDN